MGGRTRATTSYEVKSLAPNLPPTEEFSTRKDPRGKDVSQHIFPPSIQASEMASGFPSKAVCQSALDPLIYKGLEGTLSLSIRPLGVFQIH